MSKKIKLLDVVALKSPYKKHGLVKGQVGTVVESLGEEHFEVEFITKKEFDSILVPVPGKNLMVLRFEFETI